MTQTKTPTYTQASKDFTFQPPSFQISGRGDFRTISVRDDSELVVDHAPTGAPMHAYIRDGGGKFVQFYSAKGNRMLRCSEPVYHWGWEVG